MLRKTKYLWDERDIAIARVCNRNKLNIIAEHINFVITFVGLSTKNLQIHMRINCDGIVWTGIVWISRDILESETVSSDSVHLLDDVETVVEQDRDAGILVVTGAETDLTGATGDDPTLCDKDLRLFRTSRCRWSLWRFSVLPLSPVDLHRAICRSRRAITTQRTKMLAAKLIHL